MRIRYGALMKSLEGVKFMYLGGLLLLYCGMYVKI